MTATMINVQEGGIIRHLKRGSEYEVVGFDVEDVLDMIDGRAVERYFGGGDVRFKVHQQVSAARSKGRFIVVYYRALVSKPGEPWMFMRPLNEFTTDRFEEVAE